MRNKSFNSEWKRGRTLLLVVAVLMAGLVLPYLVINDEQVSRSDMFARVALSSNAD